MVTWRNVCPDRDWHEYLLYEGFLHYSSFLLLYRLALVCFLLFPVNNIHPDEGQGVYYGKNTNE